jgi:pimeloyl-ACP methyl ester carboxylesterase
VEIRVLFIAVLVASEKRRVEVAGKVVAFETWVAPDALLSPPVVLIHGAGANAAWWKGVGPRLAEHHRTTAIDLTGHGESEHRRSYDLTMWADEVTEVVRQLAWGRPTFVAHSAGGKVGLLAACRCPAAGLVLVDTYLRESTDPPRGRAVRNTTYDSRDQALRAFRLRPEQPIVDPHQVAALAEASITQRSGRWGWKFDSNVFGAFERSAVLGSGPALTCEVTMIRGALSTLVGRDAPARLERLINRQARLYEVLGAYHHVMLDQPARFTDLLLAILAPWSRLDI